MSFTFSMTTSGDFKKTLNWIEVLKADRWIRSVLEKYGQAGVAALRSATPTRSGATAAAWGYNISRQGTGWVLSWTNSNVNQGVPIALIIQTGHGTGTGGWVSGRDYINPAARPVMDKIASAIEEELKGV